MLEMRKLIKYRERRLNILVSQIELALNKTILYDLCYECHDPILLNDLYHSYGDQCIKCKKWHCTKNYINEDSFESSCAYNSLFGLFTVYDEDEEISLICKQCLKEQIENEEHCEHIGSIIKNNNKSRYLSIIYKDNKYICEECEAIDHFVIYI